MASSDDLEKGKKLLKDQTEEVGYLGDAFKSLAATISSTIENAVENMEDLDDIGKKIAKSYERDIVGAIKQISKSTEKNVEFQLKINKGINVQKDIEKDLEKLQARKLVLGEKIKSSTTLTTEEKSQAITHLDEQITIEEGILGNLKDQSIANQKNKSLLQLAKESAGGLADELDSSGTLSKVLSGNFKDVVTPARLMELVVVGIFNAFKESDKAVGELAKSMGTSYSEARGMRAELNKMSLSSNSIFVNTKNMQESMMALNKEFGTATTFSGDLLVDFTELTKAAGYSVEAVSKLSKLTTLTGGDLSDNTSEILGQAVAYNAVNKLAINEKQIVEDVAKTSAATTLSLGKSPKLIASANIAARALGTSLSKVEAIAGSLLNFEQSISNELEAELLTGKQLNLEVAREAALRNDMTTVAKEMAKNVGTSTEFGAFNVIQQEALAKAVGMTREDLAQTLIDKEVLAKLGTTEKTALEAYNKLKKDGFSDEEIAAKLGDDKLTAQLKSASIQEKLTASVEKMKEIFVAIAQPLMAIINPIVDILTPAIAGISFLLSPLLEGFKLIGDLTTYFITSLKEGAPIAVALAVALGLLAAPLIAMAISAIWGTLAMIPFGVGLPLAAIATAGLISLIATNTADDMISSPSGYGDRTLMGPEGAIALNNKDTVIAGTDLFGGGKKDPQIKTSTPSNPDNSQLILEVKRMNATLNQILQKSTNIEIDGTILNKKIQQSTSTIG